MLLAQARCLRSLDQAIRKALRTDLSASADRHQPAHLAFPLPFAAQKPASVTDVLDRRPERDRTPLAVDEHPELAIIGKGEDNGSVFK